MNLRILLQYTPILDNCQDSNDIWIDNRNNIHFINSENSPYSYIRENINPQAMFEWPFEQDWVKVFSGRFKIEVTGSIKRIVETKKLWSPLVIKRLNETTETELEFHLINEEYKIGKKYLLRLPKDKQKFIRLL